MNFSQRLVEERKRLKLLQKEFSELAGVHQKSQVDYEKNRFPAFVEYLKRIAEIGVDVQYILTGQRSTEPALTPEEKRLMKAWRQASVPGRAAALAALQAGQPEEHGSRTINMGHVKNSGKIAVVNGDMNGDLNL